MTPKLCQIFGCELCVITKYMLVGLNIFRTKIGIYLQQKYAMRHTGNSLFGTTSAAHYKDKLFTDDEFLHATIKDTDQCITCLPIKPNKMTYIKCDLDFRDAFPN